MGYVLTIIMFAGTPMQRVETIAYPTQAACLAGKYDPASWWNRYGKVAVQGCEKEKRA